MESEHREKRGGINLEDLEKASEIHEDLAFMCLL